MNCDRALATVLLADSRSFAFLLVAPEFPHHPFRLTP